MKKPWQGRFTKDTNEAVLQFTASLPYDQRLALCDIRGSVAHAGMLAERNIIDQSEAVLIIEGLNEIREEMLDGSFPFDLSFEDIHMNIEKRLIEKVGVVGGKLHTGRSRNDQVALDMHLYMLEEGKLIMSGLEGLQRTILNLAERYKGFLIPGYTHMQRAQPLLFSHHLLTYFWMLQRDRQRLHGALKCADLMPLGAGALAGTGFPLDREKVAEELGFSALYENSIDAVSDRDYILEFLSFASILIMHLSRFSEELITWSTAEFGFIELDDAYTTGSSMMPQKKNPDVAELVRGKSGRIYGALFALLTVMKGLPLAYNKDMQEDKEGFFNTVDTLKIMLPLFAEMLETMSVNRVRMEAAVDDDYLCATDLADYLVRRQVTFRDAHHIVGQIIAYCREKNLRLRELDDKTRSQFHPSLADNIDALLDPIKVIEARKSRGGTAPEAVNRQFELAREIFNNKL
ncbi:MAG: argininosuccinate lyase [Bacillota bacterium]|nr:argininosuccinate lyase [Bacillota bacterium]